MPQMPHIVRRRRSLAAAALGEASDTMMAHPLALQLRNLQSLVEVGVDKNTTVVFPVPVDIFSGMQKLLGKSGGDGSRSGGGFSGGSSGGGMGGGGGGTF